MEVNGWGWSSVDFPMPFIAIVACCSLNILVSHILYEKVTIQESTFDGKSMYEQKQIMTQGSSFGRIL